MKSELARFFRGFGYAWAGIRRAVYRERNFRFHLCAGLAVCGFAGAFYELTRVEWALLAVCVALVPALELVNSAVEQAVDRQSLARDAAAGAAKDMAAGAVLVGAAGSAVVGLLLLWRQENLLAALVWVSSPLHGAMAAAALCGALLFIFFGGEKKE